MDLELAVQVPLRDFTLDVAFDTRASILGVYGRSGSGKTSLIESLCGQRGHATGLIRFGDQIWLDSSLGIHRPTHQRRIGYVPQGGLLFPDRNVRANLRAGAVRNAWGTRSIEQQAIETLELDDLLDAMPHELSGGEVQRVALARAICSNPQLLLLDEPTASLGMEFRRRALTLLERVHAQFGLPMIVVSHESLDHHVLCDDMVVVNHGRIELRGTPRTVLDACERREHSSASVLEGTVSDVNDYVTTIDLGFDQHLSVSGAIGRAGQRAVVRVAASQVVLALAPPRGVSALNVLPVVITAVETRGSHCRLELSLRGGEQSLQGELTVPAVHELGLNVGAKAYAMIKASGIWGLTRPTIGLATTADSTKGSHCGHLPATKPALHPTAVHHLLRALAEQQDQSTRGSP